MERKKMPPAVKPRAKAKACSDQKPDKASLKKRQRPGEEFWLHVRYGGEELAFDREPAVPHLAVKVVKAKNGNLVEETCTDTVKVRMGGGGTDFVTPRPRGEGWKAHQLPKAETYGAFGIWRRPLSTDWKEITEPWRRGRAWRRGGPPPERIVATYHVIERIEGRRPIALKVDLIDTGTKEGGLVERTASEEMLWGIGLGWEADGDIGTWRRPYVKKGGQS